MSDQANVKRPRGRPVSTPESKTIRIPVAIESQVKKLIEEYRAKHAA